ncbi:MULTISPECIES: DNA-directed RNA polymerase [Vibrio]|nr:MULTISPECIES: DNA-directed RNA polymerase [Vibrio]EJG2230104.1 DNA-directed RNA polymerase [Vibrio parahaemolyticus]MCG6242662.1 DNA-directed RNA polymerase [Vibrio diabolicus]MDI7858639.1 DNA-directed RNA polymerase [Vibrio parahaemolyticus]MDW2081426.1 DNA-directed RNA polymerase [Vibrio sp. 1640]HCH0797921.1 DNA-directed RNA polymerase [Vibrio parahaemolyticus]
MKRIDTFLKLSPKAAERINKHAEAAIATANCRLPMVVPPVEWKMGMTDGGAYLTSYSPLSLFKTRNRELLKQLREVKSPEFVHFLDGHNVASRTGHCIDVETLNLLKMIVKQPRKFAKLPNFNDEEAEMPLMEADLRTAQMILESKPKNISNHEYLKRLDGEHKVIVKALIDWRKKKQKARQKAVEKAGARSNLLRTIEIAESLKHYTSIYFPTQSDDRGRVYYATPLLNPQGADHEKALILFDEAKEVGKTGWDWMRINVANLMGYDKANFKKRIAYVEAHREMIESCVANPMSDFRWEDTDKPFQFLQAARELVKAWSMEDPTKFKSRVGIACDASCSGLQILGTLTRCESSMKFTNCLPAEVDENGEEFMQDIYGEAARIAADLMRKVAKGEKEARKYREADYEIKGRPLKDPQKEAERVAKQLAKIEEQIAKDEEQRKADREHAEKLLNWSYAMKDEHSFTRNWLKRNTMTFFYGSAQFGMRDQLIVDHLEPEYNKVIEVVGKEGDPTSLGFPWATLKDAKDAATVAGNINYDAICAMAERPSRVMQSLQRYAELIAKSGKKMRWTTPLGLIVEQRYEKVEKYKIDSMITGQKRMQTTTQRSTGEVDANGQKNGAAPNWVHSLDASLLLKVLSVGFKKYGLKHWRVVHDSFAVHAADTETMVTLLKNTMADMLDRDLLKRTAEELEAQIDEEYRKDIIPFPELGDEALIDKLRLAQYPFC